MSERDWNMILIGCIIGAGGFGLLVIFFGIGETSWLDLLFR